MRDSVLPIVFSIKVPSTSLEQPLVALRKINGILPVANPGRGQTDARGESPQTLGQVDQREDWRRFRRAEWEPGLQCSWLDLRPDDFGMRPFDFSIPEHLTTAPAGR